MAQGSTGEGQPRGAGDGGSSAPGDESRAREDGARETPDAAMPDDPTSETVLELLAEGVPMTLVTDLVDTSGPSSPAILVEEGLPAEAWWEPDFTPPPQAHGARDEAATADSPEGDA